MFTIREYRRKHIRFIAKTNTHPHAWWWNVIDGEWSRFWIYLTADLLEKNYTRIDEKQTYDKFQVQN